MADIPEAPKHRPDLAATWGIVAQMEKRSEAGYRDAAQRIRARVAGYGHIGAAELAEIQRMIDAELGKLAAQQNGLLFQGMAAATAAAALGVRNGVPDAAAEQLLVRHLVDKVHSDGLNLSARLWRVHQGAAQDMKSIVDVAVQRGWSAEKALQHTMEITPELRQALEEAGSGAIAQRLERGLLHDSGNAAAKFRRVLRTEINTAHGERYKQMVRDDPEAVGLRFMLSPRHPRVDICDTHATADLYNLGPGVYPVDACPWPAHPNTFSYIEVVFEDEVGSPNPSVKDAPGDLPETVLKIRQRPWSDSFKQKTEEAYYYYKSHGIELDVHAAGRIWRMDETKFMPLSREDIVSVLKNRPNFEDTTQDRRVYFSAEKHIAFIQSKTDNMIVTFVRTKRPKAKEWMRIEPDNY